MVETIVEPFLLEGLVMLDIESNGMMAEGEATILEPFDRLLAQELLQCRL
jgi:hypothetical protein